MLHPRTRRTAAVASLVASLALPAAAQQFQTVTNFPGTARWSEGVECADVDRDGDLDVFVADGEGFASAGLARQHVLVINKLVEVGAWTLADESVARLGARTSVAKGVATGDVNGDGWVDALYSSAFNTLVPALYVNQGAANPGFFTYGSATRGFTTTYNSGSAQFGDLDNDGDLDVILGDAYNVASTGRPHLYINNGAGVFTENAAALGAGLKASQMDVQLVDIDNDLDLDFVGANKSTAASGAQYLMLNNGAATFTDASTLIAVNSGNAYEAEVGDLDGDTDLDLFFVSLLGFQEGASRNNLVGVGTLGFTNQAGLGGTVDDNEIALFDYDVDGDYDVLVGSLGTHEYLYRNNGGLSFTDQSAQIQSVSDSTLDCTVADLNNDGKYDLITVQGESNAAQWANKFYRNTGAADTLKPVVVAHASPGSAPAAGPVVVRAKVRDQVLDDGVNYVSASARYVIDVAPILVNVSLTDAGFAPSPVVVQAGTTVTWTNNGSVPRNVQSATAPWSFDSGSIPVGGTYSYTFVSPGTYQVASQPGALAGSVQVTGSDFAAKTTYSGGQIYRFEFTDMKAGLGVQLCYELRFQDWAGNVTITNSHCIPLVLSVPGTAACPGDSSSPTACPCANLGANGHGCANSSNPNGALLSAAGTVNPDTAVLLGSGMPATATAIFLKGDVLDATGSVFGDGVLCTRGTLIRLRTKTNVAGASQFPEVGDPLLSVRGATPPGSGLTAIYQTYYRNAAGAFCPPETFNVTNGFAMTW
ncbi:MAG: VCBS repeat-containing protein [Planctomycetes bacterium]|nr:VCBS repeat-containing protein [Planctomycetota bacterium]